jgi:SH3-like domain-containing protein
MPIVTTLVHPVALLAAPEFGARALALLEPDAQLQVDEVNAGFLSVRTDTDAAGYVPAAVCTPLATGDPQRPPAMTHVIQPVSLYRQPAPGSQFVIPWIVPTGETLQVIGREFQFIRVRRQDGQVGYIPELACGSIVVTGGPYPTTQLRQPVALYSSPAPGSQFSAEWIVSPAETLLVLGGENGFLLVQRDDGQLGYVPAALCGETESEQILKIGPLDLGWIAIGGGWMFANWLLIAQWLRQELLVERTLTPYLGLALLIGIAALLWLGSRRRFAARSFVIGMLLAYAFMHLSSRGALTLWR